MSLPSSQMRSERWSKGTAMALPPLRKFLSPPETCRGLCAAGFCFGAGLPLWSQPLYRSALCGPAQCSAGTARSDVAVLALEHDPEKWTPVFRKDHAPTKKLDHDPIHFDWIRVWRRSGSFARALHDGFHAI